MEGLLHPVGPEEVRTYWIRRGAALAVLILLVVGLGAMIGNLRKPAPMVGSSPPAPTAPAEPVVPSADVIAEEAVPAPSGSKPSSAPASVPPAASTTPAQADPTAGAAETKPAAQDSLPPEPANTFHQTEAAR